MIRFARVPVTRSCSCREEEEDPVVNFLKTDDGIEVFVMEENAAAYQKTTGNKSNFNYHCEDIELQSLAPKEVNVIKKLQFQRCTLCGENAVEHRLEIHCEEDKHRLGIPIVPANENLKFLYRCCVQGCPFHTIRHLRHAAAFHVHMQKHDTVSLLLIKNAARNRRHFRISEILLNSTTLRRCCFM